MKMVISVMFVFLLTSNMESKSELIVSRGQAEVERPLLLNSYLPASMQIIAYFTELMKYETKPSDESTTTTTTIRPTPYHKPGLYSPQNPNLYFLQRSSSYDEYLQRLQRPLPYFDRYGYFALHNEDDLNTRLEKVKLTRAGNMNSLPSDLDLLGSAPASLLKLINKIDEYDLSDDDDDKLRKFSENYDDDSVFLRQFAVGGKRPPPVQAYVTLLQLYDLLNQESKRLQLNKYGGYTSEVLQMLVEMSKGTSAQQLRSVLGKLVEQRNIRDAKTSMRINTLIKDLDTPKSYINEALKYIAPLKFIL